VIFLEPLTPQSLATVFVTSAKEVVLWPFFAVCFSACYERTLAYFSVWSVGMEGEGKGGRRKGGELKEREEKGREREGKEVEGKGPL